MSREHLYETQSETCANLKFKQAQVSGRSANLHHVYMMTLNWFELEPETSMHMHFCKNSSRHQNEANESATETSYFIFD